MDSGANDASTLANSLQRPRDEFPDGCEDDRGVELLRRRFVRPARPGGAERLSERLRGDVPGAREAKYRSPLLPRDLGYDMSGGAEAVET
jgi:hypothetical protein